MLGITDWFANLGENISRSSFVRNFKRLTDPAVEWFNDVMEPIKSFVIDNARNPFLWIGIILLALVLFEYMYQTLKKD